MTTPLDLAPALFSGEFQGTETLKVIRGRIPDDLHGTYYLNGPGHFQFGDFRYRHWLDGDGYIRALHFRNGQANLTAKYVQTKKFRTEKAAGKPVFRAFGTSFAGDRLRLRMAIESPANVSCWPFGNKLLAFGEQALPWELDPRSLETIGEFTFNKTLNAITPFSAHPKIDHKKGRLCNFGIKYALQQALLCYWEFDEGFTCKVKVEMPLRHAYSVHDYMISSQFAAFHLSPYYLNSEAVVRQGRSVHEALEWNPDEANRLLIFPRDGKLGKPVEIDIGRRGYCLHTIAAQDVEGGLILDVLETSEPLYPQYLPLPTLFESIKPCRFTRFEIETGSWKLVAAKSHEPGCHLDFPACFDSDDQWQQIWALGMPVEPVGVSKYYNQVLRFSWESGTVVERYHAPEESFLAGEPALAEMPDGGNYLICPEWDSGANTFDYLIFDPFDLKKGPITRLRSAHAGNLGFHSAFHPIQE